MITFSDYLMETTNKELKASLKPVVAHLHDMIGKKGYVMIKLYAPNHDVHAVGTGNIGGIWVGTSAYVFDEVQALLLEKEARRLLSSFLSDIRLDADHSEFSIDEDQHLFWAIMSADSRFCSELMKNKTDIHVEKRST